MIQIGCDIVQNSRMNNRSKDFINKILTEEELVIYNKYNNDKKTTFLAGRFAGKEAIIKAYSKIRELNYLDISIINDDNGAPQCLIDNNYEVLISISHEKEYSIAYSIVLKK